MRRGPSVHLKRRCPESRPVNLLLLTDASDLAEDLCAGLPEYGHQVAWSASPPEPHMADRHEGWLVDAAMADGRGLTWMRHRRHAGSRTPAIVISERKLAVADSQALFIGQRDVVRKPVQSGVVAARIATWQRLANDPAAETVRTGDLAIDLEQMSATHNGEPIVLTAREWELFELLARRVGRVVSRAELEMVLSRPDGLPSSNAVEVHLSAIRRKVGRHSIETIRGRGYRLKS